MMNIGTRPKNIDTRPKSLENKNEREANHKRINITWKIRWKELTSC